MTPQEHFEKSISASTIDSAPFNHTFVEEIFPQDYYAEFMKSIPIESFYGSSPTKSRFEIQRKDILEKLPNRTFWEDFLLWMCSKEVQDLIIDKFKVKRGYPEVVFYLQKKNYILGPHVDSKDKYFTSLFYLPLQEQIDSGTILCVPRGSKIRHFDWDLFNLVKKIPFQANSFLCFTGTNSYHAVERVSNNRLTMQYLIKEARNDSHFYD